MFYLCLGFIVGFISVALLPPSVVARLDRAVDWSIAKLRGLRDRFKAWRAR